jgi:membrane fusion protein (multidrug efflux system)
MKPQIISLLIISILLMGGGCKKKEENKFGNKTGELTAKADPVKVEGRVIEFGSFPLELVSNGKLEASVKASLSFRKTGRVAKIYFQNGDWVNQGQLLAELDNDLEKIDLEQAKIRLEKARLERLDKIMGHKLGARNPEDIPAEILERLNISSGFKEADLALQQATIQYEYTRLVAPVSGRAASLDSKPQNFPPTDKPFCFLINDKEFEVVFPVMEGELGRLRTGQDITAEPYALDSTFCAGRIIEINPLIDDHGLVRVKARIPNASGKLVEGMNAKVFIRFNQPDCMIVPKESLVLRNNRQVVFSLKDGRSYWNYVETGFENSSSYSIKVLEGVLQLGDTIITRGNLNLAHDAEIDFKYVEK